MCSYLLLLLAFVAIGNPGLIGGSISHEYHYVCNIGEDIVSICSSCQHAINKSMCKESHCPHCKNAFHEEQTIEVIEMCN